MFPLVRDESLTKNCLSISKSSATKYLLDMFPSKKESDLTSSDYQTYVIGASAKVTIDGFDDEYTVQNIYLDDENADYYYDCIKETVGDFVIFSEYFYPKSSENTYLDSQRMYYFTEYTYQNKYFINYLNDLYSTSNYVFFVSKNNLVNQNFDLDKVLAFRQPNFSKKSNVVETILLIVTITFAFLSIGSFIVFNVLKNDLSFALCVFTVFVPFIFFRLFYLITNNVFLFSYVGTKTCGIIMIIYLLLAIIAYVSKKIYVRKNEKHIEKIEI